MIRVQSPGMFTIVQDLGRFGYGTLGVSPSGAADPISLRLGNLLVGNSENAAALEMTLLGGTFVFSQPAWIAITGSECAPALDGLRLPMWSLCAVAAGQTVKIGATTFGARCYLAVRGGLIVEPFLGSASTHVLTQLGGLEGRQLRKGDVLKLKESPAGKPKWSSKLAPDIVALSAPRSVLRTTIAPQTSLFSQEAIDTFYKGQYLVTKQFNRMGIRLEGPIVGAPSSGGMVSEGVSLGAIQIPAGGQPIILFVEQQTTGGYHKIANIISADMPSVGQLRPNAAVQFELVSAEVAQTLICDQERLLERLSLTLPQRIGE